MNNTYDKKNLTKIFHFFCIVLNKYYYFSTVKTLIIDKK
jgi:hypothetical protein